MLARAAVDVEGQPHELHARHRLSRIGHRPPPVQVELEPHDLPTFDGAGAPRGGERVEEVESAARRGGEVVLAPGRDRGVVVEDLHDQAVPLVVHPQLGRGVGVEHRVGDDLGHAQQEVVVPRVLAEEPGHGGAGEAWRRAVGGEIECERVHGDAHRSRAPGPGATVNRAPFRCLPALVLRSVLRTADRPTRPVEIPDVCRRVGPGPERECLGRPDRPAGTVPVPLGGSRAGRAGVLPLGRRRCSPHPGAGVGRPGPGRRRPDRGPRGGARGAGARTSCSTSPP